MEGGKDGEGRRDGGRGVKEAGEGGEGVKEGNECKLEEGRGVNRAFCYRQGYKATVVYVCACKEARNATINSHGSNLERAQEQSELVRSTPDTLPFSSISTMGGRLRTVLAGAP